MPTVVPVEGAILRRILETTYPALHRGLSRAAFATLDAAESRTAWGLAHRRRFALVEGTSVLASALRYRLTGALDQRPVRICGIGAVCSDGGRGDGRHAATLIERLIDGAGQDGADVALLFGAGDGSWPVPDGFEPVPATAVELHVAESARHGAPMTLVRGGEDRDLAAIVAMGEARAGPVRFHLERGADFVKHVITRQRLLAGLGSAGARQLHFLIAEEGITAAAYVVVTSVAGAWALEECGDRDPCGARIGAILQAMLARDPGERRPVISGWLPPQLAPPQVTITPAGPTGDAIHARSLSPGGRRLDLAAAQVLYWKSDVL